MVLRSGRLEQVFGARVDELTSEAVASLVANAVEEAFDLDFKESLYGRTDSEKRELAGDVAAMANTAGGVIVLGVRENEQSQADELTPVELSDDEARRMRQVVGSLVAPMPTFDVFPVPTQPQSGELVNGDPVRGSYVIAVPRSPSAPHAVLVGNALRYPRRNGTTTYYLSESEVAQAYQARAAGLSARQARLDEVWSPGIGQLAESGKVWLAVALVPDVPGSARMDRAAYQAFQAAWSGRDRHVVPRGAHFSRTRVDQGLFHADGGAGPSGGDDWVAVDLHHDGSGFFASVCGRELVGDGPGYDVTANDELVTVGALTALMLLAEHARDVAAAGGTALLRATVTPVNPLHRVQLGNAWGRFPSSYGEGSRNRPLTPVNSAARLDSLAEAGADLVATTADVVSRLGQAFGASELPLVTHDGKVRARFFKGNADRIRAWAGDHGVEVSEETSFGEPPG